MTDVGNLEAVYSALKALSLLRSSVGDIFKYLVNAPQFNSTLSESQQKDVKEKHLEELSSLTTGVSVRFRELETACTLVNSFASTVNLGNTQLISFDPNYDKTTLYSDMITSYRWLDNMQEYSICAFQTLQNNFTKRNSMIKTRSRNRNILNNHNISPNSIDYFVSSFQRQFMNEMLIDIVRPSPFGIFSVLKITVNRTLKAVVVLRGFVIEWVLIKGFDETFEEMNANNLGKFEKSHPTIYMGGLAETLNSKLDIWTPSRYQIFQIITEHANAAILHFYAPFQMENAIKAYIFWLKSYYNLFSAKCRKCDTRLLNNMPPTWREFRTNEPYHFECRP